MPKLFKIEATKAGTDGQHWYDRMTAKGFSTREAAERYAVGLASSGQAHSAVIESYDLDATED